MNIKSAIHLKKIFFSIFFATALVISSCSELNIPLEPTKEKSNTDPVVVETPTLDQSNSVEATQNKIQFSGYTWFVRNSGYSGPGLNMFSNRMSNVWVDNEGNLHLKITYYKGKWYSAEVYSEATFGYGDYVFYLSSRVDNLDKNIVLGLFTWNNNTFQTDANSEIDIEFARWGYANAPPLDYSVQPTNWSNYSERVSSPSNYSMNGNYSTHGFKWTSTEVKFRSYYDHGFPTLWTAGQWNFTQAAGTRQKSEGGNTSDQVGIPKPGTATRVHMNLWLHDTNHDGFGDAPSDGQEVEVIVKKFEYTPL